MNVAATLVRSAERYAACPSITLVRLIDAMARPFTIAGANNTIASRFSPAEYKQLYEATRAYAREPFHDHFKWNAEQVHDYVLFLANTGLRPDEARNLEHRDVEIVIRPKAKTHAAGLVSVLVA